VYKENVQMKRTIFRLGIFTLAMIAAVAMGYSGVSGTRHDLSTGGVAAAGKSSDEDQVCVFCHTPHQSGTTQDPLWNRDLSLNATYGVYASSFGTLDSTPTEIGLGTDVSNLCMGCHDGSIAVNSLKNPSNDLGGSNPAMVQGDSLDATFKIDSARASFLGTDLSNDHPINMTYDAALVVLDPELVSPLSTDWVDSAGPAPGTVPLFGGKVQCASCHDPHNDTATEQPFLVTTNASSALCAKCHSK
jgi:predicted CXXCH cytochrome family protein